MMLDVCEAEIWSIGATGYGHLCGISYGPDGELYGIDSQSDVLVQLDRSTGAGTAVGSLGRKPSRSSSTGGPRTRTVPAVG